MEDLNVRFTNQMERLGIDETKMESSGRLFAKCSDIKDNIANLKSLCHTTKNVFKNFFLSIRIFINERKLSSVNAKISALPFDHEGFKLIKKAQNHTTIAPAQNQTTNNTKAESSQYLSLSDSSGVFKKAIDVLNKIERR